MIWSRAAQMPSVDRVVCAIHTRDRHLDERRLGGDTAPQDITDARLTVPADEGEQEMKRPPN
jgi:hypothetical protein